MHDQLVNLVIYFSAAVIVVPIFRYFGVGAILAYLFAGVIIGPGVLSLIKNPTTILHFSELGVVFLLFIIGLELQPSRLWQLRQSVFGLGLLQTLLTGLLFTAIGHYGFSLGFSTAFIAGFGLALSSTAFGVQILEEKRQLKTLHGQGSFSILLFQDLAVVPLIAAVPLLAGTGSTAGPSWMQSFKVLGILAVFVLFGIFLIHYVFRFIAESRVHEVFTATALLVVIGSALIMENIGLSMGMGAFVAGVLLANSEYRHELETSLEPFKGLLLGLFFMAVGMSLSLEVVLEKPFLIVGLVVSFMLAKAAMIYGLGRLFKFPYESSRNMAFTLPQGGEFAFVLFTAAMGAQIIDAETTAILNASVTLSMALTPFLFNLNQKYLRTFSDISERPTDAIESDGAEVIIAGFGRFGQIVSRFLKTQGISFTILEHSASQVDAARRFGSKIYYGDASRKDIVESAGGKDAKIFVLAIDDPVVSIETAKMVKKHFSHLNIIARARNRTHAIDLYDLGVTNFHRETFLTSLEVAKEVLLNLGRERNTINKRLAKFRLHDEDVLRQQLEFRGDEKKLIRFTRQANEDLDKILQADTEETEATPPQSH